MFIQLRAHSYYSLLEALPSPEALAERAVVEKMPALGLCDHLALTGTVEFYKACQSRGIQPIIGLEIGISEYHTHAQIALLATNLTGWSNLCQLNSRLLTDPTLCGDSRAGFSLLEEFAEGLICLSGGRSALPLQLRKKGLSVEATQSIDTLNRIFPDHFYLELQWLEIQDNQNIAHLIQMAKSHQLPLVATHPIYYLYPEQSRLQKTLAAIRLNTTIRNLSHEDIAPVGASFLSVEKMKSRFASIPSAISNTQEIMERCKLELPLGTIQYPKIDLPEKKSAIQVLKEKAEKGALQKFGEITPEIRARLDHEIETISKLGYETIFLIVQEIIEFAREINVPTSSRGSAASSLVAHCLGITIPDPIYHNLYFERFLNPARTSPPDIDTDICSNGRDQVIQHVFEKYGRDHVAMVGTINRFRPRSALGAVAKAHGIPPAHVNRLTKTLPYHFSAARQSISGRDPYHKLKENLTDPLYQTIFSEAEEIFDHPKHLSVHAGGIVIAPGYISASVPVQPAGKKGVIITQLDLDSVEELGLVKIDLLGIRGLTVMGSVARDLYTWRQTEYNSPLEIIDSIPEDDPDTMSLVLSAQTIGCFQIESPGMRTTLKEIGAENIDDIIRALALYRPGPIQGGLRDAYVRRHKGEEPVTHLHPSLTTLLEETYGVILYQEQVLKIAHELAGLSLADADLLRRAMSHFDPGRQMQSLKQRFIAGADQKSSVTSDTAEKIWDLMAAFAGYGFPKAHAASYALLAWRSAWCKAHFPAEFMAAVLANWGGYYSQRVYLSEARRLKLNVQAPHINHSQFEFSVTYPKGNPKLYMGLNQVRDLTRRTQSRIIQQRPFHSLEDFLVKVNPSAKEARNLAQVGAFSGFAPIPSLLEQINFSGKNPLQMSLFTSGENTPLEEWTLEDRLEAQEKILGISVDAHPLERFVHILDKANITTINDAATIPGQSIKIAGLRQSMRRSRTKKGEYMAFLVLEDLTGTIEVVVFPKTYQQAETALRNHRLLILEGVVEMDDLKQDPVFKATKIWPLQTS
jgi:DNA-directed DNA polymerase III PolC